VNENELKEICKSGNGGNLEMILGGERVDLYFKCSYGSEELAKAFEIISSNFN
jgi:hypothetical protein